MVANISEAPKKRTSVHSTVSRSTAADDTRAAQPRGQATAHGPRFRRPALVSTAVTERPVGAAALGALVIAFSAILVRLAEVSPSTAAFFRCLYALPVLGVLAWMERKRYGPRSRRDRLLALGAGVLLAADLTLWHHSIEAVGAGLATVLGNVQVVFVGLIA
jgi:EamA-like transporter family